MEFVDTNLLLYAYDPTAGARHDKASALVNRLWRERRGAISVQVLQEFYVSITRKVATPISPADATARIRNLSQQLDTPPLMPPLNSKRSSGSTTDFLSARIRIIDAMTQPPADRVRLSTSEREQAIEALGDHMSTGRLNLAEYETRIDSALSAQTVGDLRELFADLPLPHPVIIAPPKPVQYQPYAYQSAPLIQNVVYAAPYPAVRPTGSNVVAGILQLLLPFGVGRFYLGHSSTGIWQLITACFGIGILWCWIDGVVLLLSGRRN